MPLDKPRFRRDLEAKPVAAEGQSYVEVRDVATGKSFLFYDFEYQVALAFDGLALEKVIPWVKLATGLALGVDQLAEFAQRLRELGFLEAEPESPNAPVIEAPAGAAPQAAPSSEPPAGSEANGSPPSPSPAVASPPPAPDDDMPGPPEPDSVVMHPSEVVGETPPPFSTSGPSSLSASPAEAAVPEPPVSAPVPSRPDEGLAPAPPPADGQTAPAPPPADGQTALALPPPSQATEDASTAAEPNRAGEEAVLGDEAERIAEAIMHKALPPGVVVPEAAAAPVPVPAVPVARVAATVDITAPPLPHWATPRPEAVPAFASGQAPDPAIARQRIRRSLLRYGTLGILAAAGLLALILPFVFSWRHSAAPEVRSLAVTPGTIYRYFDATAPLVAAPGPVLKFPVGGRVIRIVGKGSTVASGDVVAAVEAARPLLNQLARQRERLAFTRQMAEAMHQVENAKEEERQAAKVEARNAAIASTLRELANVAVVAVAPGEVEEALTREGQVVAGESPAVRLRSPGFRAGFSLPRPQLDLARRLGFCQVEVDGYLLDCTPGASPPDDGQTTVELPSVPPALVGKPAHLARARYSSAVVLPVAALLNDASRTSVLVVSKAARLETRPVTVADRDDVEAIVVQGLDAGDKVVLEPSPRLRPGMIVTARGN